MSALFLLASCGKGTTPDAIKPSQNLEAPIIWQTPEFSKNISGFSLSDTTPMLFLAGYADSGIQLFDMDGATVASEGSYAVKAIGSGQTADFGGAELRIFPAIDSREGGIVLFAYGDGMFAPNDVELKNVPVSGVDGLCSGPSHNGGLARMAYWTSLDNQSLVVGDIILENDALIFQETDRLQEDKYITACGIDGNFIATGGGFGMNLHSGENEVQLIDTPAVPLSIAVKAISDGGLAVTALSNNAVYLAETEGKAARLAFEDALSTPAPKKVGGVALTTVGTMGSLPNGFLAVESVGPTSSQLVFVDLKTLTDQL